MAVTHETQPNKGVANGYAGLGANVLVPPSQLGTGTADATTFLRGDQQYAVPSGGGTVTSVALALPAEFTVSGSPVNTSGTLTAVWTAGARIPRGLDTTDDVVIDLATKGLVLKDTQATPHYWRLTINNSGALVSTDLGTTKP